MRQRRLLHPLAPLPTRGVGDQSVQRIRQRLSLSAILNENGKPLAYIHIQGVGLKACKEGDEIEGYFKVVRIQPPLVELDILGHRVSL